MNKLSKLQILIIFLISIILNMIKTDIVFAYVDENTNDDIWSKYNVENGKLKDWGLGVTYTNNISSVQNSAPGFYERDVRRTHDLDEKNYNGYTIKVAENDSRGWQFNGISWYDSAAFTSKYKNNLVSEWDRNGFNPFTTYNLNGIQYNSSKFYPPGYAAAPFYYRRFFIVDFEREMPEAIHGKTYLDLGNSKTYLNGTDLWIRSDNSVNINTYGFDKYPDSYGQNAQYDAMLRDNIIELQSSDGSTFISKVYNLKENSVKNYSDGTKDNNVYKYTNIYWRGYEKNQRQVINGNYLNGYGIQLAVSLENNKDYSIRTKHVNKYDKESTYYWHENFAINYNSDEKYDTLRVDDDAPTIYDSYIENIDPFGFDIKVEGVDDHYRSGAKEVEFKVWNEEGGKDKAKIYKDDKKDYTITKHVNISDYNNINGVKYFVEVSTVDNIGNKEIRKSLEVLIPNENPRISELEVIVPPEPEDDRAQYYFKEKNYVYKENEDIYWVKENEEFTIHTEGYFPSTYDMYPTRNYVLFAKDNIFSLGVSGRHYEETYANNVFGAEFESGNNKRLEYNKEDFAYERKLNNNNYLISNHRFKALKKGDKFQLYNTSTYWLNNKEYYKEYKNSNKWIKVDGTAPNGIASMSLNKENLHVLINVQNITDNESGIKRLWVKSYPSDDIYNIKIADFKIENGKNDYSMDYDAYVIFQSEDINLELFAEDNVGNIRKLKEDRFDLFTLSAKIVPLNNIEYDKEAPPVLKEGQAAVLIMEVTGEVERLDIEFPNELYDMDNSLSKTITLDPLEKYKRVDNNFIVPLYCGNGSYKVDVTAYRQRKERYASPEFIVSDSVLNGIKTRVR